MRKGTKIVLFIGLGILAAGLITVIAIFAANQFSLRRIVTNATEEGRQIEKEAKRIDMDITDPVTDVSILCVADDVTIKESEDGTCHLTYTEDAYTKYDVSVEQGRLIIVQNSEDVEWSWNLSEILPNLLNKGFSELASAMDGESHDLILTLPSAVYGTVDVANISGDIDISGKLSTGSEATGGLTVADLTIAATSGDLRIDGLQGVHGISAAMTTGDVALRNMQLTGNVEASTVSGDITLDTIETPGKATLETTSGRVELTETVIGAGDIDGTSGSVVFINSDADAMKIRLVSGDIRGTIRSPKEFHVESTSGDVSVPEIGSGQTPDGTIGVWNIEIVSGDVKLELS